ncbi:hypothetical protein [Azospirillum sp. sgz302134]
MPKLRPASGSIVIAPEGHPITVLGDAGNGLRVALIPGEALSAMPTYHKCPRRLAGDVRQMVLALECLIGARSRKGWFRRSARLDCLGYVETLLKDAAHGPEISEAIGSFWRAGDEEKAISVLFRYLLDASTDLQGIVKAVLPSAPAQAAE